MVYLVSGSGWRSRRWRSIRDATNATHQPARAASEKWRPKTWFRGGISREGSYVANGDFGGTLQVSTFLSSSSASLPPSFPFLLASAVPLLSWTFDALLRLRQRWASRRIVKSPIAATSLADDMSAVTTSILIVGALLLVALAVVYFGLVRRRRNS